MTASWENGDCEHDKPRAGYYQRLNFTGVLEHWQQQVAIINNPGRNDCANNGASTGYLQLFRMARITSFVCSVVFPGWIPDKAEHTFSKSKKAYLRTGH